MKGNIYPIMKMINKRHEMKDSWLNSAMSSALHHSVTGQLLGVGLIYSGKCSNETMQLFKTNYISLEGMKCSVFFQVDVQSDELR